MTLGKMLLQQLGHQRVTLGVHVGKEMMFPVVGEVVLQPIEELRHDHRSLPTQDPRPLFKGRCERDSFLHLQGDSR